METDQERQSLASNLEDCRAGKITFAELVKRTRPHWERLVGSIMRRWKIPHWAVDHEDLQQEMLLALWNSLKEWDPHHPTQTSLKSFVIFNGYDKAKKHGHTARKALRRDDKAPSRIMTPVSALAREGEEPVDVATLMPVQADQDERLEVARILQTVPQEHMVSIQKYLAEGSISGAAWVLLDDIPASRELGVTTHKEATQEIENALGPFVDGAAWALLENQKRREALGVSTLSEARRAILSQ